MKFVDAHVHLSDPEYGTHIDKIIEDARKANVVALVSNSTNFETGLRNIKLAEKHPRLVYFALGIHPWDVKELSPNELERTINLISDNRQHENMVAIGEIGLDRKYLKKEKEEPLKRQHEVFCEMLKLSEKLSLPAIIHSRETTPEIMGILSSYKIKKVLLHWFSNPIETLPEIVDRGYYITEGPPTVYSKQTQEIIRRIPLTNLLTETDGPVKFFGPPFKGEMTTPAFVPLVVDAIAKIKRVDKAEVSEQIFRNFKGLFETEELI